MYDEVNNSAYYQLSVCENPGHENDNYCFIYRKNIVGIQIEYTGDAQIEEHIPAVSLHSLLGR